MILARALCCFFVMNFAVIGQEPDASLSSTENVKPEWAKLTASLDVSLADLSAKYVKAFRKIDQKFEDQSEPALRFFLSSLENSRKLAMRDDELDKAIEFGELKKQYENWSNSSPISEESTTSKRGRKKEPLLEDFRKKVDTLNLERTLSIQTLDNQFLDRAYAKRTETVESIDLLRLQAMKSDNMAEAKLIRDELNRIKKMDLDVPDPSPLKAEVSTADDSVVAKAIQAFGGKVFVDPNQPGKPVVSVIFSSRNMDFPDDALKNLKKLKNLHSLELGVTGLALRI